MDSQDLISDKKVINNNIIAILALSFIGLSISAVNPALASIGAAFPSATPTTIALVTTIPTLFSIPSSLLTGRILGKYGRFRTASLLGIVILIVAGVTPYFVENLPIILVFRSLFGIGMGILAPIASTLPLNTMTEKLAGRQLGWNVIASNLGAIVFQMLGGFLTGLSWKYCFLAYLLLVPIWLIVFRMLREPEIKQNFENAKHKIIFRFNRQVIIWILLSGLVGILFYTLITNLSTIITNGGYGTPTDIALAFSAFTLGGIVGGFLFSKVINKIHIFVFVLAGVFCSLGFFIITYGQNLTMMIIGSIVFGLGLGMFMPASILKCGTSVLPDQRAVAISIMSAINYVGSFGSAYIFDLVRRIFSMESDRFSIQISAYIFVLIAIVFIVYNIRLRYGRNKEVTALHQ